MEDIKVAKHQLEVCFRCNLGFKEESHRVVRIIKQSSESYIQFFFKTITEVLTSSQVHTTPSTKFYALLTLLKTSEAKNYSFYHFLVKETDLLNYIYHCAEYDLIPKSTSHNKGTHYFSKHPSSTEMVLGFNVVRLCQEIIVDWNHLSKEFKPRKYFEIFKFLLGRIRKATQLEKPFYFINKCFDLRQDLALCNFQTEKPYIISRQNSRNVLKVPNQADQDTKSDDEEAQLDSDSDSSVDMSMEDESVESPVELMFTHTLSHTQPSSQDRRGSVLDELRRESLKGEEHLKIQKLQSSHDFEQPVPVEAVGDEVITDELETEQVEPVEQVEQVEQDPETAAPQIVREEINSAQHSPSKIPEGSSSSSSSDSAVALSQHEENMEEQKEEDIEQEKKINVHKQLLVRTQPATPDKLSTFFYLARGNSHVTSRNIESDLIKIKDSITKCQSQTTSRKSSLSDLHTSTPPKKGADFKRSSDRRATWHFGSSTGLEACRETCLVPQVSNVAGYSEGELTNLVHRGIRGPQIGGMTSSIIVFAAQEEENNDNNAQAYKQENQAYKEENQLLKEKLREYEQMIKMLEGKVENLTKQLKQAGI